LIAVEQVTFARSKGQRGGAKIIEPR